MAIQPAADVDYELLERQVGSLLEDERDFIANAANFAALVYWALPAVNWAGFYFADSEGLVLGPFGGKPACTRLPHGRGVCGRAFTENRTVVVDDVHAFSDHIVCDPESRSELVVPLAAGGKPYGVFDLDSPQPARFGDRDRDGIQRLVAQFLRYAPAPNGEADARGESDRLNERIDVQTCRDHHIVLRYLCEELSKPVTDAGKTRSVFARLRTVLLAHLKLEDDWLYPRLARSLNAIVRGKAERYRREMGGVRAEFDRLWRTWSAPDAIARDSAGWHRDWSGFSRRLEQRIEHEDSDLYLAVETGASV